MRKLTLLILLTIAFICTSSLADAELYIVVFNGTAYAKNAQTGATNPVPKGTVIQVRNAAGICFAQGEYTTPNTLGFFTVTAVGDDTDSSTAYAGGFHMREKIYFYINNKLATVDCPVGNDSCEYYRNPVAPYLMPSFVFVDLMLDTTRANATFQGSIQLNNQPAPSGTVIKVYNQTKTQLYGQTTVSTIGAYSVTLVSDDPATPGIKEGPVESEVLAFTIDDAEAMVVSGSTIFAGGQIIALNLSAVTKQTLCSFIGVTCKLNGALIGPSVQIKAYNRWGNVCGDTLGSSATPGYFVLNINKELGSHDGASNGDTLVVKFNDIQALPTSTSPSKLICVENNINILVFLDAQIDTTIDTSFLPMVIRGNVYALTGPAPAFGLTAYTVNNKLVGRAYADQFGAFRIAIGGDNPSTPDKVEGCAPNDTIMFKAVLPADALPTLVTSPRPLKYTYSADSISGVLIMFQNLDIDENPTIKSSGMQLLPNVPNPFNPTTELRFQLSEASRITLSVYNVLGEIIRTIHQGTLSAGDYTMSWDGRDQTGTIQPAGIYFVCLNNGISNQVRKICLMK
ncbi:MAG: T9SS type A sorting domain-containing protein [Candidatus Delongbacteria bacterium]|nr:T9SS type A sorting domain-containing protein [Candidatus Delongbacteria bacterium]